MKRRVLFKNAHRLLLLIVTSLVCMMIFAAPVYARDICKVSGCRNTAVSGSSYCNEHKCSVFGCDNKVKKNGYCSKHQTTSSKKTGTSETTNSKTTTSSKICAVNKCSSKVTTGSKYCSKHTCKKKNCYNQKNANAEYCSQHLKTTMPDCDDYEDYEEFMDEWDGNMPDGSDAEDYWEEW